ncbi:NAD-dependent epimerase/dehydratase family protein [Actinokineospora guangxiensis]|uniref:NAD-dependent epimerase/dehydratase family protein n=1 Tax=Actinokineospora guangxiensis TaxID=1490288 RepID=A0ABW0EMR9_9PSEU
MLVAVTGGTGFLGGHVVAALRRAGHSVRLLARDAAAVPSDVDVVFGDVLNPGAVASAVRDADAVLHAAGVYSFDSRRKSAMAAVNVEGTRIVLDAAASADVGRVVHVSTFGALFAPGVRSVGPDSPVGRSRQPYLASKMAADQLARSRQERGEPVVIAYPPALLGPGDDRLGDQTTRLRAVLRGLTPIWPRGGFGVGDVRDNAEMAVSLLTAATPPARAFGPGEYVSTGEYLSALRSATGRGLPALRLPAASLLPVGALADLVQRLWPWQIPVQLGAIITCLRDTAIEAPPGRPFPDTVTDTVRWLHSRGLLTDRQAGTAALVPA